MPIIMLTTKTEGVFPEFSVRSLSPIEVFATKIVALTGRGAARDLYDLYNAIKYNLFDNNALIMLRKCAVFYLAVTGEMEDGGFNISILDDITPQTIRKDLLPMIRNTERFDFLAAKEQVAKFLNDLLSLSDMETKFLKRFTSGHFEPELLFADSEILKRITEHPMAAWRIHSIQQDQRI